MKEDNEKCRCPYCGKLLLKTRGACHCQIKCPRCKKLVFISKG